jgi:hypothetical protein
MTNIDIGLSANNRKQTTEELSKLWLIRILCICKHTTFIGM